MSKLFLPAVFFVSLPWRVSAQEPAGSWENLRDVRAGEAIEVVDASMRAHRGDFAAFTSETISLRLDGREMTIPRAGVASVKRRGERHRRRNALLGLAIGATGGLAAGVIHGATYHERGETPVFVAVYAPIGAGIGAVAGAALPAGRQVTVYRAAAIKR
jgi:hypothetical protein